MNLTQTLKEFGEYTVLYSQYQHAIDTVLTSMQTTEECGEPSCPMLMGNSGTGKSSICARLVQLLGEPTDLLKPSGYVRSLPCLYLELPPRPTINSVSVAMLEELNVPPGGVGPSLQRRILTTLKMRETKLVILDEFQNFADKGAEKTKKETCNWIKYMLNRSKITFLLSGEPGYADIISPLKQLSARYPYRIELSDFEFSANPCSEYRKILAALSSEMVRLGSFDEFLFLADDRMAAALFMSSGGNMRSLRRILHGALKKALVRADGSLINDDFSRTVNELILPERINASLNPFLISPSQVHLEISK